MICLNCGRKLKSTASREAGYGPVCYRKMFGANLRSGAKASTTEGVASPNYDIPGQMTIKEYLQTVAK